MTWDDVIAIIKMILDFFTTIFLTLWDNEVMRVLIIIAVITFILTNRRIKSLYYDVKCKIKKFRNEKKLYKKEKPTLISEEPYIYENSYIEEKSNNNTPYIKSNLLTVNELIFYKKIKPICDKYNLHIIAKTRLADIIKVENVISEYERNKYFRKIMAKHIDFILCDPVDLRPIVCIELDDKSHEKNDRVESDKFKNNLLNLVGYKLIRVKQNDDFEKILIKNDVIR